MNLYTIEHKPQLTLNEPEVSYFRGYSFNPGSEYLKNFNSSNSPEFSKQRGIKYYNLLKIISDFSKLEFNWDSYNAEPITQDAIITAINTLNFLNKEGYLSAGITINIFPMRDGGIQFEFDSDEICAELEINPKGVLTFISFDNEGNFEKPYRLFELSELSTFLEEFDYA